MLPTCPLAFMWGWGTWSVERGTSVMITRPAAEIAAGAGPAVPIARASVVPISVTAVLLASAVGPRAPSVYAGRHCAGTLI